MWRTSFTARTGGTRRSIRLRAAEGLMLRLAANAAARAPLVIGPSAANRAEISMLKSPPLRMSYSVIYERYLYKFSSPFFAASVSVPNQINSLDVLRGNFPVPQCHARQTVWPILLSSMASHFAKTASSSSSQAAAKVTISAGFTAKPPPSLYWMSSGYWSSKP
jgi:hypothetical protein